MGSDFGAAAVGTAAGGIAVDCIAVVRTAAGADSAVAAVGGGTVVADSRHNLVALEEPIVLEAVVPMVCPEEEDILLQGHRIHHEEDNVHDPPDRALVLDTCRWLLAVGSAARRLTCSLWALEATCVLRSRRYRSKKVVLQRASRQRCCWYRGSISRLVGREKDELVRCWGTGRLGLSCR